MNSTKTALKIKCPQCKTETVYSPENPFRPFCSDRCRLIDLGQWASESYKIPDTKTSSDALNMIDDNSQDSSDDHKH